MENLMQIIGKNMKINSLSEIRNIHKGQRALVLGSGYSLDNFDFNRVSEKDVIFACNHAVTAIKHCDYFCLTDGAVSEANFFEYGTNITNKIAFLGEGYFKSPTVIKMFDKIKDKSYFFKRRHEDPGNFNFDLNDDLLIVGHDVVHVAANLAHVTGCSPIVFIGVDLNYLDGKKYCTPKEFKEEIKWSPTQGYGGNWFISNESSGKDDPSLNNSFETWKIIKHINKNIVFLNANPLGKLHTLFDPL